MLNVAEAFVVTSVHVSPEIMLPIAPWLEIVAAVVALYVLLSTDGLVVQVTSLCATVSVPLVYVTE